MPIMLQRTVSSLATGESGTIIKWEPLSAAMCDCLVQQVDRQVWHASHTLRPIDGLGPLPSRRQAIEDAKRKHDRQLKAIAKRWEKGD